MSWQPPSTESTRAAAAAVRHAVWISARWEDLLAMVRKGTARPWLGGGEVGDGGLAAMSALARAERVDSRDAPGHSPAPLHVGALDVALHTEREVVRLAAAVADAGGWDRPARGLHPVQPALLFLYGFLERAAPLEGGLDRAARDILADIRERIEVQLGEAPMGQLLHALCPFCLGRTDATPVGGARTLRVRERPTDPERKGTPEPVVICEGGRCQPFAAECSLWLDGLPAWRRGEWEWLAARLVSPALFAR